MSIHPIVRDVNGLPLNNRGTEIITRRFTNVDGTGTTIVLPSDVKEVVIHLEGSVPKARLTGTVADSQEIVWTADGITLPAFPVVKESGQSTVSVKAPSGTINVSVVGWR